MQVVVYEVGPRDGLQNEAARIGTREKIEFVNRLSLAGFPVIEVTAFVSPAWVPQMADASDVMAGVTRRPGVRYAAIVPNRRGLDRALAAGVTDIGLFAAASETFNRRNVNQSIDSSFRTYAEVAHAALAAGCQVRGYLSTAFGCPFEGHVPADRVVALTRRWIDLGVSEVAVSDTIGIAHPGQVRRVLTALRSEVPAERLALHFHDTRGMAVANVLASIDFGIATFDASAGGLGGCPFAQDELVGNIPTEKVLEALAQRGADVPIKKPLESVIRINADIAAKHKT